MSELKVFISYAREDGQSLADKIYHSLRSQDYLVWYDQLIKKGERWNQALSEALGEANCVLALITQASLKSVAFDNEVRYAQYWSRERPLAYLPVGVQGAFDVPAYLKNEHYLAISPGFTSADQKRLMATLEQVKKNCLQPSP